MLHNRKKSGVKLDKYLGDLLPSLPFIQSLFSVDRPSLRLFSNTSTQRRVALPTGISPSDDQPRSSSQKTGTYVIATLLQLE